MSPKNGPFVSGGQCVSALNESVLLFPFKRLDSGQSKYYTSRPKSAALGPLPWFPSDPCVFTVSDTNVVGTSPSFLAWTDGSTYREVGSLDSSFNHRLDSCLPPSGQCFTNTSLTCHAPAILTYRCFATRASNISANTSRLAASDTATRSTRRLLQDSSDLTGTSAPGVTSASSDNIVCATHPTAGTSAGGQVGNVIFTIASKDRVASRSGVLVTLSFTTTSSLPVGGGITLSYPSNFFATDIFPRFESSNVNGLIISITGMSPYIVAITSGVAVGASVRTSIVFSNFKMGPKPSQGTSTGVQVSTSADTTPSVCVPSGIISNFSMVSNVSLVIDDKYRVAGTAGVSAILSFVPTATIPPGGSVTLTYPLDFFLPGIIPNVNDVGSSSVRGLGAVYSATQNTSLVFFTSGAFINASSKFSITISGLVIGAASANSSYSILVSTSVDQGNSEPVASGFIMPGAPAIDPQFASTLEGAWSGVCSQFAAVVSSSPADVFRSQVGLQCIPVVHRYNYTIVYANMSSASPVAVYTRGPGYTEFLGTKYSTVLDTDTRLVAAAGNQFVLTLDSAKRVSRCASVAVSRSSINSMVEYGSGTLGMSSVHQSCLPETLGTPQMTCTDKSSYSYVCSLQRQLPAPVTLQDNSPAVTAASPYTNPSSFPTESPDSRFLPVSLSRAARAAVWAGGAQGLFVGGNFLRAGSSPYANHIAQVLFNSLSASFFSHAHVLLFFSCAQF